MKPILLLITLFFSIILSAQKKKKQEAPPSKQEMEEMMKEMQQSMDAMSEEDKATMDSLGIKMPDLKKMKNVAAFASVNAGEMESGRKVPVKDAARIAAIPAPVTAGQLKAYFQQLQAKSSAKLDPKTVAKGNEVYNYIKSTAKSSHAAGNMALALWIEGQPKLALVVMGRICAEDATDIDNQSNYSSMLIMLGGQHLAIPILNNLNAQFPKNSTILNNLGQAWFGLGEITKAEKYLDSAIALFTFHPQANVTKAIIEESKGKTGHAVDAAKNAIHNLYSGDKERQLDQLGHELDVKDFVWGRPNATDQLGLSKIQWPSFPKTTNESATAKPAWEQFKKDLEEADKPLAAQMDQLGPVLQQSYEKMAKRDISLATSMNISLIAKADKKLRPYIDELLELEMKEPLADAFLQLRYSIDSLHEYASKQEYDLMNNGKYKWGEGLPVPNALCSEINQIRNSLLNRANTLLESVAKTHRDRIQHRITEMVNYQMYTEYPEKFEMSVLLAKREWLGFMGYVYDMIIFMEPTALCNDKLPPSGTAVRKLRKFDDVACKYNDTLNLGIISFINNCSRMKSSLNLKFIEYTRLDDFERAVGDEYMSSTVKVSYEWGFDKLKKDIGPVKMEGKVGASIAVEMDRQGISDIILGVEAKAGIGQNSNDKALADYGSIAGKDISDTIDVGVEVSIGLISGNGAIKGTGNLQNLKNIKF